MIIDNHKKVFKIRLRGLMMAIGCGALIGFIFASGLFINDVLGLNKAQWAYILLGIYLVLSSYFFFLDYYYVYVFTDESSLIIRYYSLRPLSRSKKALKIPKEQLAKAEIRKSALGLKKRLIVYRKVNNKVAEYPPINLTALSKNEIIQIKALFRKFLISENH